MPTPPKTPRELFVYGTLMSAAKSGFGSTMRRRLARASVRLGGATVKGRLYDLGGYPGLVPSDAGRDLVAGELIRLLDTDRVFRWLDVYEGIGDGHELPHAYERKVCDVRLTRGPRVAAWIYLYRLNTSGCARIRSGNWLSPCR